jgi:hypothetical protein
MTEISFARSFLSALDMRPVKLSSDHVTDPKSYPSQSAYILPKYPSSPQKRKRAPASAAAAPGSEPAERTVNVVMKSTKGGEQVVLSDRGLETSVFEIKEGYAREKGLPAEKVKVLYNKKPVADSKTLKDILGDKADEAKDVEFSFMVLGGAAAAASGVAESAPVAQGTSGTEVLGSEEFWSDLQGYLQQRIRSEGDSERVLGIFKDAWDRSKS